jgi:hypothetical protein
VPARVRVSLRRPTRCRRACSPLPWLRRTPRVSTDLTVLCCGDGAVFATLHAHVLVEGQYCMHSADSVGSCCGYCCGYCCALQLLENVRRTVLLFSSEQSAYAYVAVLDPTSHCLSFLTVILQLRTVTPKRWLRRAILPRQSSQP